MSTAAVSIMQFVQGYKYQKVSLTNGKEVTVYGFFKQYDPEDICFSTGFVHDENQVLTLTPNPDKTEWLLQIGDGSTERDFHIKTIQDLINAFSSYFVWRN